MAETFASLNKYITLYHTNGIYYTFLLFCGSINEPYPMHWFANDVYTYLIIPCSFNT